MSTIGTTTNQDRSPEPLPPFSYTSPTETDPGESGADHEGRGADNSKRGGQHCGHPKEAAVPRGIETENLDNMEQLYFLMHLLGSPQPR